jgi:phosphoadenosine phosphosulfate reductase
MQQDSIINRLLKADPQEGLAFLGDVMGSNARLSSSLGVEDQLLTYWIAVLDQPIEIFTIDTGRLFQETYDLLVVTRAKYKVPVKVYFPQHKKIERLVSEKGPNSFYESVENRKECCQIRKVEPLSRALSGATVWITGLRAEQSANRQGMKVAQWDEQYQVVKYNPLLHMKERELDALVTEFNIPVNTLHKKGFPSIGCAPCTRPVQPGEDPRAGRWWWESSAKECGLHQTKIQV